MARKTLMLTTGLIFTASAFGFFFWYKPKFINPAAAKILAYDLKDAADRKDALLRLNKKAEAAKDYITGYGFDDRICFLVDMRIPSGKKRFFVYNLDKDSVEIAGLVTHGSGSDTGTEELTFSNTPNSYCTSLGKYKMGNSYYGRFGLAYKLYGLDKTNSKAFERFVVLHGHGCVPDEEVSPGSICVSLGCPTVSPAFLTQLKSYIHISSKPVLLWIYH
jgi:hypothetical protein